MIRNKEDLRPQERYEHSVSMWAATVGAMPDWSLMVAAYVYRLPPHDFVLQFESERREALDD